MELRNFITQTLIQIIEGVKDAQNHVIDNNIKATIHPIKTRSSAEIVEFDVAVTSSESNSKGVEGGIKVASMFSAGGEGKSLVQEKNISRIRFKVEIDLPHQENDSQPHYPDARF